MIGWHKLRIYNVVALKTFQRVTIGENLEVWKRFGNSENIWKSEKKIGNLGKKWKFG